jgi:hypothetical protein
VLLARCNDVRESMPLISMLVLALFERQSQVGVECWSRADVPDDDQAEPWSDHPYVEDQLRHEAEHASALHLFRHLSGLPRVPRRHADQCKNSCSVDDRQRVHVSRLVRRPVGLESVLRWLSSSRSAVPVRTADPSAKEEDPPSVADARDRDLGGSSPALPSAKRPSREILSTNAARRLSRRVRASSTAPSLPHSVRIPTRTNATWLY